MSRDWSGDVAPVQLRSLRFFASGPGGKARIGVIWDDGGALKGAPSTDLGAWGWLPGVR
jgi:hypothetical protein